MSSGAKARETAKRLLVWVLHTKEPLPPSAIISALAASHGSHITYHQISRLCANMVVIDDKCNILRFSHQSFQKFLTKHEGFGVVDSHSIIASDCIDACSLGLRDPNKPIFPPATFHDYAIIFWPLHLAQAQGSSSYDGTFLKARSSAFDDDFDISLDLELWLSRLRIASPLIPDDHALKTRFTAIPDSEFASIFLMSAFGMSDLLQVVPAHILETGASQTNELGHEPLYLAAAFGHATAVAYLAKHGAEINVECGRLGSPLHAACFSGHKEVVEELLNLNADVGCGSLFEDALEASLRGHQRDIALLLIQHNCMEATERSYELALQQAARAGFPEVVNELQSSPFASDRGKGNKAQKRILKAIQSGDIPTLELLLGDKGDFTSLLPPDAVAIATLYDRHDMVKYLLDKGMSIEASGLFGSPLMSAAMIRSKLLVNLLLDGGANVNASGPSGDAMQVAAAKGHDDIIRILLAKNANVNQHCGFYGYAIQAAAYHGHELAVKLLLKAGAETSLPKPGHWSDACAAAREGGHAKISSLLSRLYSRLYAPPSRAARRPEYERKSPSWRDDRKAVLQAPLNTSTHETIMWDAMTAGKLSMQKRGVKRTDPLRFSAYPSSHETVMWISELSAIYMPTPGRKRLQMMQALLCDWPTPNPIKDITPKMALLSAIYHGYPDLTTFPVHEFSLDINQAMFSRSVWHHHTVAEVATALEITVLHERHSAPVVLALLEAGAALPPDDDGWNRLLDSVFCFSYSEDMSYDNDFGYGLRAILSLLLSKAPERKAYGPRFGLALQMAAAADDHSFVDLLLARQVDINFVTRFDGTALYTASSGGHYLMAQKLLNAGAIVNLGKKRLCWPGYPFSVLHTWDCIESPIHAASAEGRPEQVKELLDRGAGANQSQPDFEGVTPLILASAKGHIQVLPLLISAGADIEGSRALEHAAHLEIMEYLFSRGAKMPRELDIAHMLFNKDAEQDRICRLIQNNCTQDTWDTIFTKAFESDFLTDSVFRCLTAQTSPNMDLLALACRKGFLQSVQHIFNHDTIEINGVDVRSGRHLLQHAASEAQYEVMKYLISKGAKLDYPESTFSSPLTAVLQCWKCLETGRPKTGRPGKHIIYQRVSEIFPMRTDYYALIKQFKECKEAVQLLITNGADVNDDKHSSPPLHSACFWGFQDAVKALLDAGASLAAKKNTYELPIFAAIEGNHPKIVKLLITRAHPTDHEHPKHGTPLDYARSLGRSDDIIGLLCQER